MDAIKEFLKNADQIEHGMITLGEYERMNEILRDVEPVIRCKDCKWSAEHYDTDGNVPYWVCKNWDGGTDADGYCHEAERKEE